MNNPFDWKNYKAQISMKDVESARKSAYQATQFINRQRQQGIEPSLPYAERNKAHLAGIPQEYTVEMPAMPLHERTIAKKRRAAK